VRAPPCGTGLSRSASSPGKAPGLDPPGFHPWRGRPERLRLLVKSARTTAPVPTTRLRALPAAAGPSPAAQRAQRTEKQGYRFERSPVRKDAGPGSQASGRREATHLYHGGRRSRTRSGVNGNGAPIFPRR